AAALVAHELADGSTASERRVLRTLGNGSGATDDIEKVSAQIKQAWGVLTGETLEDASPTLLALENIFDAEGGSDGAATSRRSWEAVLTAIFLSPEFITY